jgi:hypothetical protein
VESERTRGPQLDLRRSIREDIDIMASVHTNYSIVCVTCQIINHNQSIFFQIIPTN